MTDTPPALTQKPARKKAKPKAMKPWKAMTSAQVRARLATGVHFSSKPVNTNASAAGIRLAADAQLKRPLIGLVTTQLNRRVVDYVDGATEGAYLSQCASVLEGTAQTDYKDMPAGQSELIESLAHLLDEAAEVGTGSIDPRLRQVLFPDSRQPKGYVVLTPLHSSVLSAELTRRQSDEAQMRERNGDPKRRTQAQINVGGAKPWNAGRTSLITAMQRSLIFEAPGNASERRAAYWYFNKGVPLNSLLQRSTVAELSRWRKAHRTEQGDIASTSATREEERALLIRIGQEAMVLLDAKRALMAPYVEELGGWANPTLSEFRRSLLDKDARHRGWPRELTQHLLSLIEGYKPSKTARPEAGYGDIDDYQKMIEEGLK
ncbi:hypothetical protein [Amphibiibacter pelophylacis]|uniref:Uncharacterized protein n=1 Tax=Amphibiibacter pelophylacis TaxID=1799477 RepID=A0ACC6P0X0_9BURK